MNITIIGAAYVGLVTGVCLAENANHVTCFDYVGFGHGVLHESA